MTEPVVLLTEAIRKAHDWAMSALASEGSRKMHSKLQSLRAVLEATGVTGWQPPAHPSEHADSQSKPFAREAALAIERLDAALSDSGESITDGQAMVAYENIACVHATGSETSVAIGRELLRLRKRIEELERERDEARADSNASLDDASDANKEVAALRSQLDAARNSIKLAISDIGVEMHVGGGLGQTVTQLRHTLAALSATPPPTEGRRDE